MQEATCIEVQIGQDLRPFTVAAYDAIQRQQYDQPLWARAVPPVQDLTEEPASPYPARITDRAQYDAQMRRLLGLY